MDFLKTLTTVRPKLAEAIKTLIYQTEAGLFDFVDFEDDEIFLEPLLFAYFTQKESDVTLVQILYQHLKEYDAYDSIKVFSDAEGRVYLPGIGWLCSDRRSAMLVLQHENEHYTLLNEAGQRIPASFEPAIMLKDGIELVNHPCKVLDSFYRDMDDRIIPVEIDDVTRKYELVLQHALDVIATQSASYYKLMQNSVKKLAIFNSSKQNSFASLSVHGMAFLNAYQPEYNEVFFVDDLAHQCGHVIFNTITFEKDEYLKVSPDAPISQYGSIGKDHRSVYVVYHFLFISQGAMHCLDGYLSAATEDIKGFEALGRMGFYLEAFKRDYDVLKDQDVFTKKGKVVLDTLYNEYDRNFKKYGKSVASFKYVKDRYNFNVKEFFALNESAQYVKQDQDI